MNNMDYDAVIGLIALLVLAVHCHFLFQQAGIHRQTRRRFEMNGGDWFILLVVTATMLWLAIPQVD